MPRSMDDTFHRLLWITLVAVAFTFTVILTSVFVDIDDLIAKRTPDAKQQSMTEALSTELPASLAGDFQEFPSIEDDTDENYSSFRTKRSLESNNYLLHIKSPKVKKILTNRLATLLEELDEEESLKATNAEGADLKDKNTVIPKYLSTEETAQNTESVLNIKDTDKSKNEMNNKDILHLAMHNILLQGIIGHMDLNEVYKKVHLLIKSFEINPDRGKKAINESKLNKSKPTELIKIIPYYSSKEEDKFFNELIKCEKLQKQILQSQDLKMKDKQETAKDSHMLIRTTIEITNNNKRNENFKHSIENTTGSIKLVYNGKEINMIDGKNQEAESVQNIDIDENHRDMEPLDKNINTEQQNIKESALDQAIAEYLKTHSLKFHNKYNVMTKGSFITKRLKRQVKIRYLEDQFTTEKSKRLKEKSKYRDDELYVEIETHFDGKGTKGEKKKKLVRCLIDKIQKAIKSNVEVFNEEKSIRKKHPQIKKRTQNPIDQNELISISKSPINVIEHRQLNPISKTANVIQPISSVLDKSGDTWKKIYNGPGFLTASKSLNSAEMRELDIDYNSVMKDGIPKRLQQPINTESEDFMKPSEYTDMGNVTLFLKDINGSGFSIGINQYVDEPPDTEALKMFTGLENLLQTYHEHYDQAGPISNESEEQSYYVTHTYHEIKKRDVTNHKKIHKKGFAVEGTMDKENDQEKNFFDFTQSNPRKRPSMNVKLFSNIRSKTKLNKFINTNAMVKKKIIHKSKRNKRQIDKIRIVASDRYPSTSSEDIFLLSRENTYANRAMVKEEETPEVEIGDRNEEHYDFIAPYSYNMDIPNLHPAYLSSSYDTTSLHTGLMSKYPHIFLENISRTKDLSNVSPSNTIEEKNYQNGNVKSTVYTENDNKSGENNVTSTNVDDIVNAILPSRNNFKVVVKIFPKNNTNIGPGYKEVHTLINKSYDKNGVRYVSSLNVSEVSKFESLNKTKEVIQPTAYKSDKKRQQNQIKLLLELYKDRIDHQLEHLKLESQKLKQIIGYEDSNKNISYLIDVFRHLGLKSLYGRNYFQLNDSDSYKYVTTISNTLLHNSESTMKPHFTATNKQEDAEKLQIISSMKESQIISREILQKIDNNTNILQLLLQKLLDQTQSTRRIVINTEKILTTDKPKYLVGEQVIHPVLEQLHTNFTNAIPFIYAFQHPLTENKGKPLKTVANVIYHGHIYANKFGNDEKNNDFLKSVTNNLNIENVKGLNTNRGGAGNGTRFFIDELENDFKLVSNVNDHLSVLTPVKTNITKI